MIELSQEAYTAIGALVVTNVGTAMKLFLDWRKSERDHDREEAAEKTKQEVETAILREQITSLSVTIGEVKEGLRDLRADVTNAYGKWREKNPS